MATFAASPGTTPLARQRCFTHGAREAVCRCPQCRRFYCRECVTEHEGRLLCSSCLKLASARARQAAPSRVMAWMRGAALWLSALALAWVFFYCAGQLLIELAGPVYVEGGR